MCWEYYQHKPNQAKREAAEIADTPPSITLFEVRWTLNKNSVLRGEAEGALQRNWRKREQTIISRRKGKLSAGEIDRG